MTLIYKRDLRRFALYVTYIEIVGGRPRPRPSMVDAKLLELNLNVSGSSHDSGVQTKKELDVKRVSPKMSVPFSSVEKSEERGKVKGGGSVSMRYPLRHYFRFNHICTICPYTTNWVKTYLNLVLMVVHFLLNRLFQVRKVVVASGLKGPVRE